MNFFLHDLLSSALPSDVFSLPWVHEQGHKLGYPHDTGMAAQTVETLWTLAGEEGAECSGRLACLAAWSLVLGREGRGRRKRLEAFSLFRRRFGGSALRRFLHEQDRFRWLLEGEGIPETAGALAALSWIAGERVDGWFRALGWDAPAREVEKGLEILARFSLLPPSGLEASLRAFRASLVKGGDPKVLLGKVKAVRPHRERAGAALAVVRRLGRKLARPILKAFLEEALRAGALSIPDAGRRTRRAALAAWIRFAR